MAEQWIPLLLIVIPIAIGFGVGSWRERRHFVLIARRETKTADMRVNNLRFITDPNTVRSSALVSGQAVIATDFFKSFAASLRNIIGGEVRVFETLMERARREARLRMIDEAMALGATEIWNVRFETSNINSSGPHNPAVSVEVFVFGTAVVRQ